jgi:hypothetical protein
VEEFLMMLSRVPMLIGLLFLVRAALAEPPPQATKSPTIHHTACSLGESMAGKLGAKKMNAEAAQRTCKQLAPSMNSTDAAEFMRCCTKRLQQ